MRQEGLVYIALFNKFDRDRVDHFVAARLLDLRLHLLVFVGTDSQHAYIVFSAASCCSPEDRQTRIAVFARFVGDRGFRETQSK